MEKIIEFLKSREDIKISTLEKELGLANATIKVSKGYIIPKHLDVIRQYLIDHYGYSDNKVEAMKHEDNKDADTQIVKMYNKTRIPGFKDNKLRYKDSVGLWRFVDDYVSVKGEDGKVIGTKLKDDWEAQTGEMCVDLIGKFYIANNGRKVYVEYNKVKK